MSYATVQELYEAIRGEGTPTTVEQDVMQSWLDAANNAIDVAMNHPAGFLAREDGAPLHFMGLGKPLLWITECVEVTLVEVRASSTSRDFVTWVTPSTPLAGDGDWFPLPLDAGDLGQPYNQLCTDPNGSHSFFTKADKLPTVRVTARLGYANVVPPLIKQICLAQAGRWYNEGSGGFSGFTASPETGELRYTRSLRAEFVQVLKDAGFWNPPI